MAWWHQGYKKSEIIYSVSLQWSDIQFIYTHIILQKGYVVGADTTPSVRRDNQIMYNDHQVDTVPLIHIQVFHDDVIKWKYFPHYWPFVQGIHRSPVNSPHKDQWRGALMFSLIWINGWVNNRETGNLRHYRAHYEVIVMCCVFSAISSTIQWVTRPSYL